jgi:hypothetical protein
VNLRGCCRKARNWCHSFQGDAPSCDEVDSKASQPMTALVMLACHSRQTSPPVRVGSRLSLLGKPAAIPSNIHARLRLSPSKCASFGSLGSGDTTGCNHLSAPDVEICGMNVRSQRANSWLGALKCV